MGGGFLFPSEIGEGQLLPGEAVLRYGGCEEMKCFASQLPFPLPTSLIYYSVVLWTCPSL